VLTHSLTHSLTDLLTRSLTDLLTRSLTDLLTRSLTHALVGSIPQSGEDVYNIIHTLLVDGDYDDADSGFTGGVDSDLDTEFLDDELLKASYSDNYCIQDETIPWYNQVDFIIDGTHSLTLLTHVLTHLLTHLPRWTSTVRYLSHESREWTWFKHDCRFNKWKTYYTSTRYGCA
jgi:hypothetical protein